MGAQAAICAAEMAVVEEEINRLRREMAAAEADETRLTTLVADLETQADVCAADIAAAAEEETRLTTLVADAQAQAQAQVTKAEAEAQAAIAEVNRRTALEACADAFRWFKFEVTATRGLVGAAVDNKAPNICSTDACEKFSELELYEGTGLTLGVALVGAVYHVTLSFAHIYVTQ